MALLLQSSCKHLAAALNVAFDSATSGRFTAYSSNSGVDNGLVIEMREVLSGASLVPSNTPRVVRPVDVILPSTSVDATRYSASGDYADVAATKTMALDIDNFVLRRYSGGVLSRYGTTFPMSAGDILGRLRLRGVSARNSRLSLRATGKARPSLSGSYESGWFSARFPATASSPAMTLNLPTAYVVDSTTRRLTPNRLLLLSSDVQSVSVGDTYVEINISFPPFTTDLVYEATITEGGVDSSSCFPGSARLTTPEGSKGLGTMSVGDVVLVKSADGAQRYEKIPFLHSTGAHDEQDHVAIEHSHGTMRVSSSHLLLKAAGGEVAAKQVQVGQELQTLQGTSTVLAVSTSVEQAGMFAPLTSSGTVVVDGVVASNYAGTASFDIPHSVMHASFFVSRLLGDYASSLLAARYYHDVLPRDVHFQMTSS
eukprot:TRINITY_DN69085_c0_g1_i1.p1 TRINITY_DN69085_c0_g1~~TRINITY_DN69085_c0_g1_i1.p1  ORF type:complete len:457 (+),score=47.07 TRINITY_DN69085_c0_g1_i1:92-1372(+)